MNEINDTKDIMLILESIGKIKCCMSELSARMKEYDKKEEEEIDKYNKKIQEVKTRRKIEFSFSFSIDVDENDFNNENKDNSQIWGEIQSRETNPIEYDKNIKKIDEKRNDLPFNETKFKMILIVIILVEIFILFLKRKF